MDSYGIFLIKSLLCTHLCGVDLHKEQQVISVLLVRVYKQLVEGVCPVGVGLHG